MSLSIWRYRQSRYVKISAALAVLALLLFLIHNPTGGRHGGTWVGYALGGVGALLTLWLAWYGFRRRRYGKHTAPLEEVLSAHVNLGLAALLLATLHTGFEFGWNLHFLSYGFLLLLTLSGLAGVLIYAYVPIAMTENAKGRSTSDMIEELAEINRDARRTGAKLDDEVNRLIRRSVQYSEVGGSAWKLLTGRYRERHTEDALEGIRERAANFSSEETEAGRILVTLLARKVEALERLRNHLRFEAWMDVWRYVHVPLTFAYLAALIGHIVFVFYY